MTLPVLPAVPYGRLTIFVTDGSGTVGRCRVHLNTPFLAGNPTGLDAQERTMAEFVAALSAGSVQRINKYFTFIFRPVLSTVPGEQYAGDITMLFENALVVQPVGNLTLTSLPTRTASLLAVIDLYESLFGALQGIVGG